jgi:predicted RNA binding protein YcfA (HicA-like mRNA interferase family)
MVDGLYHEVVGRLKKAGYRFHRQAKGSHELWKSRESGQIVLVARSLKSAHLANKILRSAGLPKLGK